MNFWQDCRNFVAKNPKIRNTFPNCRNVEVTFFWTNFFFHQKRFFSNGECNFDNPTKNFPPKTTDLHPRFQKKTRKNLNFSKRKLFIVKLCFCTCWIQLRSLSKISRQNFEKFCSNSCKDEKIVRSPKKLMFEMFVWTSTMKAWRACRNFVAKNTKNFPELLNCWSYIFWNKIIFFIKNDSLATENAFLTTLAKTFF